MVSAYFEPFLGGAAVFLAFDWPEATLADTNSELIATYRALARDADVVRAKLASLEVSREMYDTLRKQRPRSNVDRAVRLLYLNRCAYGGIYRTDRSGTYNVPYSGDRSTSRLTEGARLSAVGAALRQATLIDGDFESALSSADDGAFVYCDPTYALPGAERSFRRYGGSTFGWTDQVRLADVAHDLASRGAVVVVSNADDRRVQDLYHGGLTCALSRRANFPNGHNGTIPERLFILAPRAVSRRLRKVLPVTRTSGTNGRHPARLTEVARKGSD